MSPSPTISARCRCGQVAMQIAGDPIITATCYCDSCRKAALILGARAGAPTIAHPDGGTDFVLYRKDRASPSSGVARLREFRLGPDAHSRRIVAACCASPMFMEFNAGHWLSVYRDRLAPEDRPPIETRTMLKDLDPAAAATLDGSVPSSPTQSPTFMWRLLKAWVAMGFKVPKIGYVNGTLDA